MTDYTKLVEALRICANTAFCNECPLDDTCDNANKLQLDAADAIEALEKQIDSIENEKTNLEADIINLEIALDKANTQLPKRGEWIEENRRPRSSQFVCSECHRTAYDPQPTRDKAWKKRCRYAYCPNCGAKMTEVQE